MQHLIICVQGVEGSAIPRLRKSPILMVKSESQQPAEFNGESCSSSASDTHQIELVSSMIQDPRSELLEKRRKLSLEKLLLGVPVVPRHKLEVSRYMLAQGGQALIKKGKFRGSDVVVKSFPKE